ncbi:C6 finger domain [Mycena kentingensis (nom. inval.)]|nr:C6 finger domain [Mycena kentingensis (nom. inval.)]
MSNATTHQRRPKAYMACLNCRKRKIRCKTNDYEDGPCERCVRKKLDCQYVPVGGPEPVNEGIAVPALPTLHTGQNPYSNHPPMLVDGTYGHGYPPAGSSSQHSHNYTQSYPTQYDPMVASGSVPAQYPTMGGNQQLQGYSAAHGYPQTTAHSGWTHHP